MDAEAQDMCKLDTPAAIALCSIARANVSAAFFASFILADAALQKKLGPGIWRSVEWKLRTDGKREINGAVLYKDLYQVSVRIPEDIINNPLAILAVPNGNPLGDEYTFYTVEELDIP